MSTSPGHGRHTSAGRSTKPTSRQACDQCRNRKRKCSFDSEDDPSWMNRAESFDAATRCRNCERADSPCTYLLPLRARGPKRKIDRRYLTGHYGSLDLHLEREFSNFDGESPISQQSLSNYSVAQDSTTDLAGSPNGLEPATREASYPTDRLCPRDLVRFILRDYLLYVYPLIPVIHRPSFETDFEQNRDAKDQDFLTLIVSLCAVTVALLPSRFHTYREHQIPLPFRTRTEMANHCYYINQSLRDTDYFDTVSHQKWASSFLLGVTYHQTGNTNLWRMLEVESMQLLRLLEVQHVSSYVGLDYIEAQLRKKAFWLMFYGYVHQMHNLRNERVTFLDPTILRQIKLEELMPISLEDEFITSERLLPCPEETASTSLTAGFNIHSRIFSAAIDVPKDTRKPPWTYSQDERPKSRLAVLQERRNHLKYMLDTVNPAYRPWNKRGINVVSGSDHYDMKDLQREAVRANIHVTHIWLQSMLLDQIDDAVKELQASTAQQGSDAVPMAFTPQSLEYVEVITDAVSWDEREDLCRQLLHTLHSFSYSGLESNGLSLVYKVRDVAVPLLACESDANEERARRAKEYLREFSGFLSKFDASEKLNTLSLQSWVDTSRDKAEKQG